MNDVAVVKQETDVRVEEPTPRNRTSDVSKQKSLIDISSSSSSTSDLTGSDDPNVSVESPMRGTKKSREVNGGDEEEEEGGTLKKKKKKQKVEKVFNVMPLRFVEPLSPVEEQGTTSMAAPEKVSEKAVVSNSETTANVVVQRCKQFWKAGDYEGAKVDDSSSYSGGMDHVRVHPRFLHSNATSHKWALGAFAELLDNSVDEVCNGATYVNVDKLENKKDGNKMLVVEDNGGGMKPDKMRACMSLGYSEKSKLANTIGQYGNGFKTSTMRLGADVIVFSRCQGKDGMSPTQSIGLLSYTFLTSTGKEDIVVPIVDYVKKGGGWNKVIRKSADDWDKNLETIVQWSPYVSEEDLMKQFDSLKDHGTRIVIYNIWEDDQGQLELDFDTDPHDIQIRGVNRDEKKIEMANKYPNSRHFLTYQHSLRSYASILYLKLPAGFQIFLRGKEVDHHNLVNDMMLTEKITYKPLALPASEAPNPKESNMFAVVTIGFTKDAEDHIDIQGFNVYHKNRLIKPFWRVWNAAGSDGRGVIGVLEANFVEPAHDKQGFERTIVLSRLEARLIGMQKHYWSNKCHEIGYAPRRGHSKKPESSGKECSPSVKDKTYPPSKQNVKVHSSNEGSRKKPATKPINQSPPPPPPPPPPTTTTTTTPKDPIPRRSPLKTNPPLKASSHLKAKNSIASTAAGSSETGPLPAAANSNTDSVIKLKEEIRRLKQRLLEVNGPTIADLQKDLVYQKDRCKSYVTQLEEAQRKIKDMDKEQEALIDIFQEERNRRAEEEEILNKRLKVASDTITDLREKVTLLESTKVKTER